MKPNPHIATSSCVQQPPSPSSNNTPNIAAFSNSSFLIQQPPHTAACTYSSHLRTQSLPKSTYCTATYSYVCTVASPYSLLTYQPFLLAPYTSNSTYSNLLKQQLPHTAAFSESNLLIQQPPHTADSSYSLLNLHFTYTAASSYSSPLRT
jgi:hypothetical protein